MLTLAQDSRYALRTFRKNPAFTTVAVLSLALGIGANTAIFSLIDAVLLRWLPVQAPQQLTILGRNPDQPSVSFNYPDYEYVRDHNHSFNGVIAYSYGNSVGMTVPGETSQDPQLAVCSMVSGNYFEVLGVTPAAGRVFSPQDNLKPGAHPYAVLSYDYWRRRFGANPAVLGKYILLNNAVLTVVGVARAGFHGAVVGRSPDLFVPIMEVQQIDSGMSMWKTRHFWWLNVMGRLRRETGIRQAQADLDLLFHQIDQNDPETKPAPAYDRGRERRNRAAVLPGSQGFSRFQKQFAKPLIVLAIVVGLVLLIACANVANLLFARGASREKEIGIRLAIGASRTRLIAQLLVETVILALLGGAAGLAFAWWGARLLMALLPVESAPVALDITPDLRILGFAFGVSLLTALMCGLVPAFKATRPSLLAPRVGRLDLRKALVVAQVAVCLLLLIGAGLFVRSLDNLRDLDPGFVRENVLIVGINPRQNGYKGQRLRAFYEQLLGQVRSMPQVRAASLARVTPLSGSRWNNEIAVQGYSRKPDEEPSVDFNAVSPDYFQTMGIPLLLGRDFRTEDNPATSPDVPDGKLTGPAPVAIINQAMAKKFWGDQSPIGRRFSMTTDQFQMDKSFEVVGVVKDTKYFGLRDAVESMVYVPDWRLGASPFSLCVRTAADPEPMVASIRREASHIDSSIPVLQTLTMEQQLNNNVSQERIVATLCSFFGGLALLLAVVGLYGLMAHTVTRRTREIGIRMALGAVRGNVMWLVMRETILLVVIGAAIGVPIAFGLTRFVKSFLYGLTPQDPANIVAAAAILTVAMLLAGYIPARRATRVDPMVALRWE
ncbi:MAG TPA: ABC transporter permease [Bryobacteraceae bacterium]|nr:ABC transporter permease [Bryobacteraceae bacterium]